MLLRIGSGFFRLLLSTVDFLCTGQIKIDDEIERIRTQNGI